MKTSILLLTVAALFLPAHAGEKAAKGKEHRKHEIAAMLKKRDTDKNGEISKEEFLAGAKDATKGEKVFAKLDRNSDGKLSKEDRPAKK